jgi:predicted TPR repeat methyltransferase
MSERAEWDAAAATFDEEADHGLTNPSCRAAWSSLLRAAVPAPPGRLVDLGCGTGSVAELFVEQGHRVTGVDYSEAMVRRAVSSTMLTDPVLWGGPVSDERYLVVSER